jgi:hypothetical protein
MAATGGSRQRPRLNKRFESGRFCNIYRRYGQELVPENSYSSIYCILGKSLPASADRGFDLYLHTSPFAVTALQLHTKKEPKSGLGSSNPCRRPRTFGRSGVSGGHSY